MAAREMTRLFMAGFMVAMPRGWVPVRGRGDWEEVVEVD